MAQLHVRQSYGLAMSGVGVLRLTGLRTEHLRQDQDVAWLKVWKMAKECRAHCSLRQAALQRIPCVERQLIVRGVELEVVEQLEYLRKRRERFLVIRRVELDKRMFIQRSRQHLCGAAVGII